MSVADIARIEDLTAEQRSELLDLLDEVERRQARRQLFSMFPDEGKFARALYPRQLELFAAGAKFRERAFIAGNRVGKTVAAGTEWSYHLTGLYPHWWDGRRYSGPIRLLISGDTHETTRDILQLKMLGSTTDRPDQIGTGLIPGDSIKGWIARNHVKGAIERATIKHAAGGESELWLRSYEQGREIFQGFELDGFWPDEECPQDVYDEGQVRLMTRRGMSTLTFTPLRGLTPLVINLINTDTAAAAGRHVTQCGWDDVPHLDEDIKLEMLAKLPPRDRDARTKGIPSMGAGAIYPVPESDVVVDDMKIPDHWARVYGLDVGWNRTAAVWGALDRDADILYITAEHYRGQAEPSVHAESIKARGAWIPGVIDPAARGRGQKDGEQLYQMYVDLGLKIQPAANSVESGIYEVWQRLSTGRLKVFKSCQSLLGEYRLYRRNEKGAVVKENDHALDALRYLVMSGLAVATTDRRDDLKAFKNRERGWR